MVEHNRRNFIKKCITTAVVFSSGAFAFSPAASGLVKAQPTVQRKKEDKSNALASKLSRTDIEILQFEAMVFGCSPSMPNLDMNK